MTMQRWRRELVLGVPVDAISTESLTSAVSDSMASRQRLWVAHHNLHSVYLVHDDDGMQQWYDKADLVFADGMSMVLASRLAGGGLRREHRATLLDWMPMVLENAARGGHRVHHLGGHPDWAERGADVWRQRHRGLDLTVSHGYFDWSESADVVDQINRADPSLLLVGMGMPRQERWLAEHADQVEVPVIVTVGAFLGYAAGATSEPPRWMGQVGLEWAWRLAADPRRMARRYLVEPLHVIGRQLAKRSRGVPTRRLRPRS